MTEPQGRDGTLRRWLVEPPRAGEARVFLDIGEDFRLTPQAQKALEVLLVELYAEDDVKGQMLALGVSGRSLSRPRLSDCVNLSCPGFGCPAFTGSCPGFTCTGFS